MEHSAVAYRANDRLIVAPIIRTTTGLSLEVEPIVLEAPDQQSIAEALTYALARSGRIVAHPKRDDWKGFFDPFLKAAGVRSRAAFMKDATRVSIEVKDETLKLTPQRNLGSKLGFEGMSDAALYLPRGDLSAAAAAVSQLLDP